MKSGVPRLAAAQPPRREDRSHAQAQPSMARTGPERPLSGAEGGVEPPRGPASQMTQAARPQRHRAQGNRMSALPLMRERGAHGWGWPGVFSGLTLLSMSMSEFARMHHRSLLVRHVPA